MSGSVKSNMKTYFTIISLNCFIILPFFFILFPNPREESSVYSYEPALILLYLVSIILSVSYFVRLNSKYNRVIRNLKTKEYKPSYHENHYKVMKQFAFVTFLISSTVIIIFLVIFSSTV